MFFNFRSQSQSLWRRLGGDMRSLDLSNQGLSSLSDCQTAQSLRKVLQDCHVTKKHLRTCKLGKWVDMREEIPVFFLSISSAFLASFCFKANASANFFFSKYLLYFSICSLVKSGLQVMGRGVGSATGLNHGTEQSLLVCNTIVYSHDWGSNMSPIKS